VRVGGWRTGWDRVDRPSRRVGMLRAAVRARMRPGAARVVVFVKTPTVAGLPNQPGGLSYGLSAGVEQHC